MSTEMPNSQIEISDMQIRKVKRSLIALGALALIVTATGIFVRTKDSHALSTWTAYQALPTVTVISPTLVTTGRTVMLPGHLEAWEQAAIHSRVSGYVKSWKVDIGAHVKAGQLLAEIDTPELDQQIEQAKADLTRAEANATLANSTAKRWSNLLNSDSVSKQEADEKMGDAASHQAAVTAAKANLDRLAALESFKRITAPFDGVVTARRIDVGALISAGDDHGPELFSIADVRKLRLYVSVPQSDAAWLKPGMEAELNVPGQTKMAYKAKLVSTSEAVNRASGAVLAQFVTDSSNGNLLPGSYVSVQISLPAHIGTIRIPASSLMFRSGGTKVAILGAHNRVELKDVHIAMDSGETLDIDRGLGPRDLIIDTPPDSLIQGDKVQLAKPTLDNKVDRHAQD